MQHINTDIGNVFSSQCLELLADKSSESYLVDVRSIEEWKDTGIADLSSIGKEVYLISWALFDQASFLNELRNKIANKEAKIFFICASGGRSRKAAEAAFQDGYFNVYNVTDGFLGNIDLPRRAL